MSVKNEKIYWEAENIDRRIGEVIHQLEEWGIADETLVIFIGHRRQDEGSPKKSPRVPSGR